MTSTGDRLAAEPLVLVTVGTDHHPFDRLVGWADAWAATAGPRARVLVQTGTSTTPETCDWEAYLERSRYEELVGECSVVVCHGGPGTIAEARRAGHVPIVVPRRHALGEHVDDHQVRFCARMSESGYIVTADSETAFRRLLDEAILGNPAFWIPPEGEGPLPAAVHFGMAADVLLAARSRRRRRRPEPHPLVPLR